MRVTRQRFEQPGSWLFAIAFLLVFSSGCASWFTDKREFEPERRQFWFSITPDDFTPNVGQDVTISAFSSFPLTETFSFNWDDGDAANGEFTGTGPDITWTSAIAGTFNITCTLADLNGNETVATIAMVVGVGHTWTLTGLKAFKPSQPVGEGFTIIAEVTNPDVIPLTYTWSGPGNFSGEGETVAWYALVADNYTLTVVVSDGTNEDTLSVDVVVPKIRWNRKPGFVMPETDPSEYFQFMGDVFSPVATQRIHFIGLRAVDPDEDEVTYKWTADGAGEFTEIAINDDGIPSAFWAADAAGTYIVSITADDGISVDVSTSPPHALSTDYIVVSALPTEFNYGGYESCYSCHSDYVTSWLATAHATKEDRMQEMGMGRMESCRECHAVGYDNGGYIDYAVTNQFANIQCESCHGSLLDGTSDHPGGGDITTTFDAENCGVCHTGSHHPTIDEWRLSGHGTMPLVDEDGEPEHNVTGTSCMKCHNGEAFVSIIVNGEDPPEESLTEVNDGMRIGCATCHDPHDATLPHQLRIDSEGTVIFPFDDIEVSAGAGNTCVSCHNGRRTRDNYDSHMANGSGHFGTHHGPQGPILFGMMGADLGAPADYDSDHAHAGLSDTCVNCHMGMEEYVDADNPAVTGHTFAANFETCAVCHTLNHTAEGITDALHAEIAGLLQDFVDAWPAEWKDVIDPENTELYNRPEVSDPPNPLTDHAGPPTDDPVGNGYRETLWNYTLVVNDGSLGVHNPHFVRDLLTQSIARVNELNADP